MSHVYSFQPDQSLRSLFVSTGLQVIVKMASVELTPEKPVFEEERWHMEGQMNEHIAMTAIYYLESENVTPSHLSFRMQTDSDQEDLSHRIQQNEFGWAEQVYGACLCRDHGSPCLQNYGSVEIKEARLVAFPNVFQTRQSSFELADKTKPGYQKFIVLWLVDPRTRIISTANVPPQQGDWWLDRAFGGAEASESSVPPEISQIVRERAGSGYSTDGLGSLSPGDVRLPFELMEIIREELGNDAVPMSREEAEGGWVRTTEERGHIQTTLEQGWKHLTYMF